MSQVIESRRCLTRLEDLLILQTRDSVLVNTDSAL
jgi:hypothetical protein